MAHPRPALFIALPSKFDVTDHTDDGQMPRTPEAQRDEQQSAIEPPPPPRPQAFKVKRKRVSSARSFQEQRLVLDTAVAVIPTIEMSEVPAELSSPTLHPTSAHLLSPIPLSAKSLPRALTPPKTPAPKLHPTFSQLESPAAEEWDLINRTKPAFERSGSICSSFSDSSISSYGSSDFSLPTGGYDSPRSEMPDPFLDADAAATTQDDHVMREQSSPLPRNESARLSKRVKTRRDVKWTQLMDDHLWMTFMAYLSDPTLTPFKMLPGSTPPMGLCDQVAARAKRTWRSKRPAGFSEAPSSIDALIESNHQSPREGSPDTIRPSSIQTMQTKWPKVAATRRRLRELCVRRPSISAHYQRMLRTRSPSPFETSSPPQQPQNEQPPSSFSSLEMHKSLVTSTAPSMQPDSVLAQLAASGSGVIHAPRLRPQQQEQQEQQQEQQQPQQQHSRRSSRPEGWFNRIPRSKAHRKSASLQSELISSLESTPKYSAVDPLASPFDAADSSTSSHRSHLLQSMTNTKSLGRTDFNGRSLGPPVEFRAGAPTDRRSRKRRFRSDEEKPRRPPLEDVFGPLGSDTVVRNRGFSVGAVRATDSLTKLFTPPTVHVDLVMGEASDSSPGMLDEVPLGSRSAPRRLAEPVPRLGSPFVELPFPGRQHNTFPRTSLLPTMANQEPFQHRLMELAAQHAAHQPF